MASNGMHGTKAFQDTIAQYLMAKADNDPLVAVKLANPSKTMEQCCANIIGEVKKSNFSESRTIGESVSPNHLYAVRKGDALKRHAMVECPVTEFERF